MIRNDDIDELISEMRRRHGKEPERYARRRPEPDDPGRQPFVLFLGPECAAAAGVPSMNHTARLVLDLVERDEELSSLYPSGGDTAQQAARGQEPLRAFYGLMNELKKTSGDKIYRMLLKLNAKVPVPLFYQDLALLIKAGYFERVLTTNIDTLLEQSLDIAGLQAGYDYHVTSLGVPTTRPDAPEDLPSDWGEHARHIHIVKLFGDLAQEQVNITPEEIDGALRSQRRYVKSELEGDIVMVGYNLESKPINEWLRHGGRRREQLWWVAGGWEPQSDFQEWAQQLRPVTGRAGRPEEFFGQLKLRLMRRHAPEPSSDYGGEGRRRKGRAAAEEEERAESAEFGMTQAAEAEAAQGGEPDVAADDPPIIVSTGSSVADVAADVGAGTAAAAAAEEDVIPPDEEILIEDLRRNIRRSQAVLFSLEQTSAPGDLPANVLAQIIYQKQQIAEMEDRIRALSSSRRAVTRVLAAILKEAEEALAKGGGGQAGTRRLDDAAVAFLRRQYEIVSAEYARPAPNQFVVAAAAGGALLLAERLSVELGPEIISPCYVRRLAAFTPSVAGRGGA